MRPTNAANEAILPPSRSRKSSMAGDRRPSVTSTQPTSFFLAREEDVFKSSSRRSSTSHKSDNSKVSAQEKAQPSAESTFAVQSLEAALGAAFGTDKDKQAEIQGSSSSGLAGLLKRKRPAKPNDGPEANETSAAAGANDIPSKQSSPQRLNTNVQHTPLQQRNSRTNTISAPLTPLQLESPFPESAMPSTPRSGSFRSLRLSDNGDDADEAASQAITSGGEEDDTEEDEQAVAGSSMVAPQLVMPSLAMPSRRPFTERGKQMGRLKIAVAGANAVGKTSLIRAIVRQCEDIVHLDPITTQSVPIVQTPQPGKRSKKSQSISEIQASTKAYPAWWSDMEESRVLRRRKSMGETVLERNISFIDSSGFDTSKTELNVDKLPLVQHLEALFQRNAALDAMNSSDLLAVLSGAGGLQVDVVLFICSQAESVSQNDFAFMTKLSRYATVIPVIAKADASPEAELARRKSAITNELPRCNINASVLHKPQGDVPVQSDPSEPGQTPITEGPASSSSYMGQAASQAPFLVSCMPGSDDGEMDASLLMSPSYSPPLVGSELQALVNMLFEPETMAKLRHISARKFLQWRAQAESRASSASPERSLTLASATPATPGLGIKDHLALARRRTTESPVATRGTNNPFNLSSTSSSLTSIGSGLPDFSRARIQDHIAREERLAQVQLAKWAADLQRGLRREREEYARLVEGDRARWLLRRIGEESAAGRLDGTSTTSEYLSEDTESLGITKSRRRLQDKEGGDMQISSWARRSSGRRRADEMVSASNPLGLCYMADSAARTGGLVLKALGGGVLVGAVWMAICRTLGWEERWWVGLGDWTGWW